MTTNNTCHAITATYLAKNGSLSTATATGTLDKHINRLERLARTQNLPLFCETTSAMVEVTSGKLHRETWNWFLDATPANGGIVELRDYPGAAVDIYLYNHRARMVTVEAALAAEYIPYYEGEVLRTKPAPVTRAMVEAYALLIHTHLAKGLDCTVERVSCEPASDVPLAALAA